MAFGLSIKSTSNSIQIDELFKNFSIVESGSLTTVSGGNLGSHKTISKSSCTTPLLAIASSHYHSVTYLDVSSGTFTWDVEFDAVSGTSFDYYIFDIPSTSSETMGIRVWNASSELIFDSGKKYLRMIDFKTITSEPGNDTYTSGRTYAVIQATPGMVLDSYFEPGLGIDVTDVDILVIKISSNTVDWKLQYATTIPTFIGDSTEYGRIIVADVTGY